LAAAQAIPPGHVRARTTAGWLDDVAQHPAMLLRRGDAQERILAIARVLAAWATWPKPWPGDDDWERMLTRPTWEVLQRETGLSRSTVAAHLAWLRHVGLLGLVAGGTTPDLSPAILQPQDGDVGDAGRSEPRNEAAVYVLMAPARLRLVAVTHPDDIGAEHVHDGRDLPTDPTTGAPRDDVLLDPATGEIHTPDPSDPPIPDKTADHHTDQQTPTPPATSPETAHPTHHLNPVDETRTPTPSEGGLIPLTRAHASNPNGAGLRPVLKTPPPMCQATPRNIPDTPPWPLRSTPAGRKSDHLAAAATLQAALPALGRISTAHVAHLAREWFLAGWTPADVLTALGRRPDGTPWRHDHDVRHVPGWFRHRLAPWRHDPADPASPVTRSPHTRRAADAAHQRAVARARSEQLAAEAAAVAGADRDAVHALADAVRAAHRAAYHKTRHTYPA
jgi:hypothetical protein